jgi:hypothetical protein
MATITCRCERICVNFPADKELFRHECCCHDCISALWYATQRGGPQYPLDLCADCCWLPNEFSIARGAQHLGAFMNYASADTTRFYCADCWTVLFADHPFYEQKVLVSQIGAYKEFEGLTDIERSPPQARHFLKDRSALEIEALPPWAGNPAHVYSGVAEILMESFPTMKAAGGAGKEMNAQILLQQLGPVLIPTDAPRLSSGPPTLMQQRASHDGA